MKWRFVMFMLLCVIGMIMLQGCRVLKVEDKGEEVLRDKDGNVLVDNQGAVQKVRKGYEIYHNGHWLRTEAEKIDGSMNRDGVMKFTASGLKSDPSEEFNKTMQTYTKAFVEVAQIAAAAYNPSSSAVTRASTSATQQPVSVNMQTSTPAAAVEKKEEAATQTQAQTTEDCPDCKPQESAAK